VLLALPIALLSLAVPCGDLYSKVDELKEPDWSEAAAADLYAKVDDLKVPEWAAEEEFVARAISDNDQLYAKLEDLKDPYAGM
jgi:hypothetical protein